MMKFQEQIKIPVFNLFTAIFILVFQHTNIPAELLLRLWLFCRVPSDSGLVGPSIYLYLMKIRFLHQPSHCGIPRCLSSLPVRQNKGRQLQLCNKYSLYRNNYCKFTQHIRKAQLQTQAFQVVWSNLKAVNNFLFCFVCS